VISGFISSVTVNELLQVLSLPDSSFTVIITGVTPVVTMVPTAGDWVMIRLPTDVQLSEATTPEIKLGTVAEHEASANAD